MDQNIVKIYNEKNIKLFGKDFFDVALEAKKSMKEAKRHNLILKIDVSSLESCFLFIIFMNFHSVISTSQVL